MTNAAPDAAATGLAVTPVGGPTALLEYGGLRLLTDPTFDAPGDYEPRPGVRLKKTNGPALGPERLGVVDAVLLSHDHHKDNLDDSGRDYLSRVGRVLTTVSGAERLGAPTTGMDRWQSVHIQSASGAMVEITAVPAQHGPDGSDHLTGEVTGFYLSGHALPTVYVSGDNASVRVVSEIVDRLGGVELAVLFAGGAQMPYLGQEYLTLPSDQAAQATLVLGARRIVPLHYDGWAHFSQDGPSLIAAFERAGMADRLAMIEPGTRVAL